jgi:hypothetical protein
MSSDGMPAGYDTWKTSGSRNRCGCGAYWYDSDGGCDAEYKCDGKNCDAYVSCGGQDPEDEKIYCDDCLEYCKNCGEMAGFLEERLENGLCVGCTQELEEENGPQD